VIRAIAAALLLAAGLAWLGLVVPARSDRAAAQDDFARARDERQRLRRRLAALERRAGPRRPAAGGPVAQGPPDEPAARLRRAVLDAVGQSAVSNVRLSVSTARAPASLKLQLAAEGRFADLVPLTGRLVSGPPRLVVERLRLRPADGLVRAELDGFQLAGEP